MVGFTAGVSERLSGRQNAEALGYVSFFPVWVPGSQDDDDILLKGDESQPEIGPPACVSLSEKLCGLGGSQIPGHRDTTENRGIENGGLWA